MKHVGRSFQPAGARGPVSGRARYAGDIDLPRMLHMRLVRAPVAFGRIVRIDADAARGVPGVVAIWTADDAVLPPVPVRVMPSEAFEAYCQPVLAAGTVRYVGEPFAAVFAESAGAADDAAELVIADIDPYEPLLDATADATLLSGDLRATECATVRKGFGDVTRVFHNADRVVERRVSLARDGAMALEPRVALAAWDADREVLRLWGGGRAIHQTREAIATMMGLADEQVEVESARSGGSFGSRGELCAEDMLASHAARSLGRPVRWIEDRREQLTAAAQARGMEALARVALDDKGRFLALDVEFWIDQGAYLRAEGTMVADLVAAMLPGPYALDAYRAVGHVRMTNKPPAGSFRGAGRVEATFIRERLIDGVADAIGRDGCALRCANLAPAQQSEARSVETLKSAVAPEGVAHDDLLAQMTKRFSLDIVRRRAQDRRGQGELAGIGTAFFTEPSDLGPFDHVRIAADTRGNLEVVTAAAEFGQGTTTAIAQIVADIVGVDLDRIRVTTGRTDRLGQGGARILSSGLALAGTAAQYAAESLRDKIVHAAARMMAVPADRLSVRSGRIREADRHFGTALELGALVRACAPGTVFAGPDGTGLQAEGWCLSDGMTTSHGLAIAAVEIDEATGFIKVPRVFIACDVGNAINPDLITAQIEGAVLQGTAGALSAALPVGPSGDPLAQTLADYGMPTAAERPVVEVLLSEEAPTLQNPLGIKGVGAAGIVGIGAAIAAGIDQALGVSGFANSLPVRPAAVRLHLRQRADAERAAMRRTA
ncbi:xanthine dehydrogenase family protein molybdopterin-binding subunit [Acuticoccus sp. MNP-M23]|uniref:xanthine dehydrogenase family protein molybdopterin-binding subunit n=1 Tax=Acuticoccus sp. MNP-M23 TaxID=3072793 RepID=UPI00281569B5|nr:xanthine dehydrogenase family protein molybdopterin-binding subunit [Acuticoccus sp. MNP-M23]WMS40879.1 xanthine dehydrogenase family protein molybdopterin-binding subunit [Acuticoccus sp. MNP-M23]